MKKVPLYVKELEFNWKSIEFFIWIIHTKGFLSLRGRKNNQYMIIVLLQNKEMCPMRVPHWEISSAPRLPVYPQSLV